MYSMVILDDEKIVLQGIQKLCQKEDFGFVIKGAFVDSDVYKRQEYTGTAANEYGVWNVVNGKVVF